MGSTIGDWGAVEEFVDNLATKADSGAKKIYFQTLVSEDVEMMELLADSPKGGV